MTIEAAERSERLFKERQKNPKTLQSCGPIFNALEVIFLNL